MANPRQRGSNLLRYLEEAPDETKHMHQEAGASTRMHLTITIRPPMTTALSLPLLLLLAQLLVSAPSAGGASSPMEAIVPVSPLDIDETSIAAGIQHSCAIQTKSLHDVGGRVLCWGDNNGGQSDPPRGDFIQVSSGRLHSCGIRLDETIACWGVGAANRAPEGLFDQVSSGDFHTCGLLKDKSLRCWGTTAGGIAKPPPGQFIQVSCGRDFSCAITIEGRVKCWGENGRGQTDGPPELLTFRQISAAPGDFACGVTVENDVVCWGDNHRDQGRPPRDTKFLLVSTSRLAACGIKLDRTVVCWGMRSGVTAAPKDVKFDELTLGWNHGCGIRYEDGGVQCWGDPSSDRLEVPSVLR